jgi:hypothetical protein
MELAKLRKFGGISLIIGSVLLTAYSIFYFSLLPILEVRQDMTTGVLNSNWIWIAAVAFFGVLLMMFGFTALYSKMYNESGKIGFLGYIFVEIAYLLQACKVTWEICVYPVIAMNQASAFLLKDAVLKNSSLVVAFRFVAGITILLGIILFCVSLFRSKQFSRIAAILILIGALIYGFGPMLSVTVAISGIVIFSIGCLMVGLRLIKKDENA